MLERLLKEERAITRKRMGSRDVEWVRETWNGFAMGIALGALGGLIAGIRQSCPGHGLMIYFSMVTLLVSSVV